MVGVQDNAAIADVVIEALRSHLGMDAILVATVDDADGSDHTGDMLVPIAQVGLSTGVPARDRYPAGPDTPLGRVLECASFLTSAADEFAAGFPEVAALVREEGFRRVWVQPFRILDRTLGAAIMASRVDRELTEEDRQFLAALAIGAGGAMQRLRAVDSARRRTEEAETLARMTRSLMEATSLEDLGYLSWLEAAALHGAERGAFYLADWQADELIQVGKPALSEPLQKATARMSLRRPSAATDCIQTGKPVVIQSRQEYLTRYAEAAEALFDRVGEALPEAAIGVPVRAGDRLIGSLTFGFLHPRKVSERDVWLATSFADSTAVAVERLEFFEAEQVARKHASALARASAALFEAETPADVGRIVLDETRAATGAFSGTITLFDPNEDTFFPIATFGGPAQLVPTTRRPLTEPSIVGEVMRTGRPVVVEGEDGYVRRYPEFASYVAGSGCRALMGAPLIVRGRTIGAFSLAFDDRDRIAAHELKLLESIGNTAAEAIDRLRAHRLLGAVIDQMPLGVGVFDPRGQVQAINDQVSLLWRGRPPGGFDEGLWGGVGPEQRLLEASAGLISRSLKSGETVIGQNVEIERLDGSSGTLEFSCAPMHDEHGTIIGAVAVISDATGRVAAERAREAFLAVLSHELRTPITSILLATRQLMSGSGAVASETSRELLVDLEAEAERLNRVVDNLLVLSRLERGAPLGQTEPVLLQHLLPTMFRAEEKLWPDVCFTLDLPSRLPMIQAEPGYLEQVIRNLMANAAKYGGPAVEVSAGVVGGEVRIRVRDWGPGIPVEDRRRVFELFYRAPGMTRSAVGAGIGLFVVRQVVEAMGGRVWVDSADEPGACLVVAFPAVVAEEA